MDSDTPSQPHPGSYLPVGKKLENIGGCGQKSRTYWMVHTQTWMQAILKACGGPQEGVTVERDGEWN